MQAQIKALNQKNQDLRCTAVARQNENDDHAQEDNMGTEDSSRHNCQFNEETAAVNDCPPSSKRKRVTDNEDIILRVFLQFGKGFTAFAIMWLPPMIWKHVYQGPDSEEEALPEDDPGSEMAETVKHRVDAAKEELKDYIPTEFHHYLSHRRFQRRVSTRMNTLFDVR